MSMNVNTTGTVYGSYQNTYKAGTVDKKKETAKTTENDKVKKNVTESIAEKNLSKEAQKMLKDMRGSRTDMDFMVADFENGDNAKDILAQSDKEFTVIFSKEEMEKMLKRCIVLKVLCVCRMKSMLSLDLKEHLVRQTE